MKFAFSFAEPAAISSASSETSKVKISSSVSSSPIVMFLTALILLVVLICCCRHQGCRNDLLIISIANALIWIKSAVTPKSGH